MKLLRFCSILFLLQMICCSMKDELIVFYGEIIKVESDGIVISKNDKKFVIVNVYFVNLDTNRNIKIEYHMMKTNDMENIKTDMESLSEWTFPKGTIMKVNAKKTGRKYVEEMYSIQQLYYVIYKPDEQDDINLYLFLDRFDCDDEDDEQEDDTQCVQCW